MYLYLFIDLMPHNYIVLWNGALVVPPVLNRLRSERRRDNEYQTLKCNYNVDQATKLDWWFKNKPSLLLKKIYLRLVKASRWSSSCGNVDDLIEKNYDEILKPSVPAWLREWRLYREVFGRWLWQRRYMGTNYALILCLVVQSHREESETE